MVIRRGGGLLQIVAETEHNGKNPIARYDHRIPTIFHTGNGNFPADFGRIFTESDAEIISLGY